MTTQKKIMKVLIIIILVMFLLSSVLLSVMYLFDGSKNQSADINTGDLVDTWAIETILTGSVSTGI